MTALHFDTLLYTNQLIEAGVPREVAQVHAQTLRQAFGFYVDDLVTRDHLDKRLAETDARIEQRFADQDLRIEKRLADQDVRIEQRFAEQDLRFERRFSDIDSKLSRLDINVRMLTAVVIAGVVLPNIGWATKLFYPG